MAADPEFVRQTAAIALSEAEEQLVYATRAYEDAARYGDAQSGSQALADYALAKQKYDVLAGANNNTQQNNGGQLSAAQRSFLSRRQAGGDTLDERRLADYRRAHDAMVARGVAVDSPEYFSGLEWLVDHQGDGKQPPLTPDEVCKMSGISAAEYNEGARRLAALKRAGMYSEE